MWIPPNILASMMTNVTAGAFATPVVRLFQDRVDPVVDRDSFTEADFSGYTADATGSWAGPYRLPPNSYGFKYLAGFTGETIAPPDPTVANVVKGYFLTEPGTAGLLLSYGDFDSADYVPMQGSFSQLELSVELGVPADNIFGNAKKS